ncbi:iron-sulfur cluster assembly protein, partial [Hydrocarboniphaga effusa]|uniref:iron-sulfur cluster assembly protein n=1 Tax=Hydrocarboniphaga effusa TaxID=243629 RepID=UPI00398BC7C6
MSQVHQQLQAALSSFVDPLVGRDLMSAGVLRRTEIAGKRALIDLELGFPAQRHEQALRTALAAHVQQATGLDAQVTVRWKVSAHAVQSNLQPLAQIRNI